MGAGSVIKCVVSAQRFHSIFNFFIIYVSFTAYNAPHYTIKGQNNF